MKEFKIYSISDEYIEYLRNNIPNVYSNKEDHRTHTRKYVGVVLKVYDFFYYIPLSSAKKSDYQKAGDNMVIKKSIIPIYRIVIKNSEGKKELKGTLRISHMIPVPESELELYDIDNETDYAYKTLVQDEIIFIRKHAEKIKTNALILYNQKIKNDKTAKYVDVALDFKQLESLCLQYQMSR